MQMKKNRLTVIIASIIVLVVALGSGVYSLFYDTQKIEGQEMIAESDSPDGKYTVTAYLNKSETDSAVLCSVTAKTFFDRDRNIYYNYPCDKAEISWSDNDTVVINGIEIDVRKGSFDCRKSK